MNRRLWPAIGVLVTLAAFVALAAPFGVTPPPAAPVRAASAEGPAAATPGPVRPYPPESGPVVPGPAPLTGPPSAYKPLVIPNFGPNVRANTDTQTPNLAQQEPSIAINPTNPLDVVAAAKDERAGTNTKMVWIYTSTDGGTTWANQIFPFSGSVSLSSDPVVNFSDDGECYVTALPYSGGSNLGLQVARSTDGGVTFSTGVHLPGSNSGSDKEWTWVDNVPTSPYYHRIYTAWMDFGGSGGIALNYSTDRGVTWSNKVTVGSAYQFPMPVSLPNGNVILTDYTGSGVAYRRSTDGGQTFGPLTSIASISDPNCPPDNPGCSIWRLNPIPANSVNPNNGHEVVTWADGRTGTAIIYYSRSTDNGTTWSAAAQLAPPGVANTYQVEPWVVAEENGTFHAIWYDDRQNPNTSVFNIYYSQSTDDGATWSTAQVISTATSDLRIGIPSSYAQAAGDYINITASHDNVYAAWTDTRSGTGEDIYTVRGIINQGTPTPTVTGTPPTATPTRTATRTPTLTPTPCAVPGVITNGGFETGSLAPWTVLGTNPAPVVTPTAHSGTYSALLGSLAAPEPTGDSSLYQQITVPAGGGTLSFWWNGATTDSITYDWQDAYITSTSGTILATIMHQCQTTGGWINQTYNMTPYAGQTVRIEFLVHQDGFGDVTSMFVDDVALLTACATGTPATATATAVQPTATTTTILPTITLVPPTITVVPPTSTATAGLPTATMVPPTETGVPGTATATAIPATQTAGILTHTPVPPTSTAGPSATPCVIHFTDVHPTDYFYTPVTYLYCHGVISGYADNTFRPYNNTTRSQMVKIVVLGFNKAIATPTAGAHTFADVPPANPFFSYIETAASLNIVSGYTCGGPGEPCDPQNRPYFRPYANVTRGELSKIDVVAAGWATINPTSQTFADVFPNTAFYTFVETAYCHGIISGYTCGGPGEPCDQQNRPYFRQNTDATRGQIAKIVYLSITNSGGCTAPTASP